MKEMPFRHIHIRDNYFKGWGYLAKPVTIGCPKPWPSCSPLSMEDIIVERNTFERCALPEICGEYHGRLPLFKDNKYIIPEYAHETGICEISAGAPLIKPLEEILEVYACMPTVAEMQTRKNADGQFVTVKSVRNSCDITFKAGAESYYVPEDITVANGAFISFRYDASREKWILV
jgi:hypothetical protein